MSPDSPPSQSPPPTISPLLGHPADCPRGLASLPVETRTSRTSRSFMSQAPAGRREQNVVGGSYRSQGSQSYSRFPALVEASKGQAGQKWGNPHLNSSVCPAGPDRSRLEGRTSEARPLRKPSWS
uniref:Uncharacterized protein n=1 Tax=Molossus molossus TaxID=27622 RepID=A0A7J8C8M5_MOLMO|nr:hypothetical protein HJG59_009900 [Molossus molossus]